MWLSIAMWVGPAWAFPGVSHYGVSGCVVWMASITILSLLLDFCLDLLFLCGPSSVERQGHDGSQMLPGSWEEDIQPAVPAVWLVRSQGKPRFKGMEKVSWQRSLHTNVVYQCGCSVNYHPPGYTLDMVSIPRFPVLRDWFNYVVVVG